MLFPLYLKKMLDVFEPWICEWHIVQAWLLVFCGCGPFGMPAWHSRHIEFTVVRVSRRGCVEP
jgi:hypothetical protein